MTSHYFGKLSKEERKIRTLNALAFVFQRMIRIVSQKDVVTNVVDDASSPHAAWTVQDGRGPDRVTFNVQQIGELDTAADIVRATGLAHHERCHIMFSPLIKDADTDPLGRVFRKYGAQAHHVWNVMEDQRIESFDVAVRGAARHYYAAAVAGYILNGSEAEQQLAWLLVHGRRYLGPQIRDALRQMFKFPQHIAEASRIIDEYRMLNLFSYGDRHRAAELVEEMRNLFYDKMPEQPAYGHHAVPTLVVGKMPKGGGEQDKAGAAKAAAKVRAGKDEQAEDDPAASGAGETEDEDSGEEDGDWDDWEGEDEDDDADGEDGEGDGDGSGQGSGGKGSGGHGAGSGGGESDKAEPGTIQELLAELIVTSLTNESVKAEAKRSMDSVKRGGHQDTIGNNRGWVYDSRPDTQIAARTMSRRLDKMKADLDPGWDTHQPSGRLAVKRMATKDPRHDEAFDVWQEGATEASDIETVIIGDVSGSMSQHVRQLSNAMWSMKAGHDKIGAKCTVYAFDDKGYLVWGAKDRAVPGKFPNVPATGGTTPKRVLIEAARILSASKSKRKLFVAMTDGVWYSGGYWGDDEEAGPPDNDIIAEMNQWGVTTAMVYLTGARDAVAAERNIDWHNTQIHRVMADLSGFAAFGDELVRRIMANR